jgi:hypothetical protein
MITQRNPFLKRVGQFTVVSVLTIPMIGLSEKPSSAIPLTPILDRAGRSIVEAVFNVDSAAQETPPATQPDPNVQQETASFPEFPLDASGVQNNSHVTHLNRVRTRPIPNETAQPNPGPRNTNPIESRIMAMSTKEALQLELYSVRTNYQKWQGDFIAIKTQTRLAQIIHLRANQVGVLLQ